MAWESAFLSSPRVSSRLLVCRPPCKKQGRSCLSFVICLGLCINFFLNKEKFKWCPEMMPLQNSCDLLPGIGLHPKRSASASQNPSLITLTFQQGWCQAIDNSSTDTLLTGWHAAMALSHFGEIFGYQEGGVGTTYRNFAITRRQDSGSLTSLSTKTN